MKRILPVLIFVLLALGAFLVAPRHSASGPKGATLVVYCAAGLKNPVEAIAAQYLEETGTHVQLEFGGTASLLSAIRTTNRGDLFLAADSIGIEQGRQQNLLRESVALVRQRPVLAVRKGNPKRLKGLGDLQGVRLALANPEAAAIGRVTRAVLGAEYEALAKQATVMKPTVTEIAADLSLGAVDAAILWDSTVAQFPSLEAIRVARLSDHLEVAAAAVIASSKQAPAALDFARFLAAPEKGGVIFTKMGFDAAGGQRWTRQ